jgi:hypothetical protein
MLKYNPRTSSAPALSRQQQRFLDRKQGYHFNPPPTFYHIRHSCGHSFHWRDHDVAFRVSNAPCPRCGCEIGVAIPTGVNALTDRTGVVIGFDHLVNNLVPIPEPLVRLMHMRSEECCRPLPRKCEA